MRLRAGLSREYNAECTFAGVLYLCVKTIERAHSPKHMWERIKLSNNYSKALEQVRAGLLPGLSRTHDIPPYPSVNPLIFHPRTSTACPGLCLCVWCYAYLPILAPQIDKELQYWPNFTVHKCKQRVTKITQYLIKMRKLKLRDQCVSFILSLPLQSMPSGRISSRAAIPTPDLCAELYADFVCRPKLVGIKKKQDRRETVRERKALSAAHLERAIEKELLERLKSKAYGDAPLNVNESVWQAILDKERAREKGAEAGVELEDEETDEEDEEEIEEEGEWGEREFVSDISGDEDGLSDLEEVGVRPLRSVRLMCEMLIVCRRVVMIATKTRTMTTGLAMTTTRRGNRQSLRSASGSPRFLNGNQNVSFIRRHIMQLYRLPAIYRWAEGRGRVRARDRDSGCEEADCSGMVMRTSYRCRIVPGPK